MSEICFCLRLCVKMVECLRHVPLYDITPVPKHFTGQPPQLFQTPQINSSEQIWWFRTCFDLMYSGEDVFEPLYFVLLYHVIWGLRSDLFPVTCHNMAAYPVTWQNITPLPARWHVVYFGQWTNEWSRNILARSNDSVSHFKETIPFEIM